MSSLEPTEPSLMNHVEAYTEASELMAAATPNEIPELAQNLLTDPIYGPAFRAHRELAGLALGFGKLASSKQTAEHVEQKNAVLPNLLADSLKQHLLETRYNTTVERLPHQIYALRNIMSALRSNTRTGFVESATSTGKTYLQAKLAAAAEAAGLRVLLLAPTMTTADQLYGQSTNPEQQRGLTKFTDLVERNMVARQYGEHKARHDSPVVVSTYQSLNNFAASGRLGEFDVILGDEIHKSLGRVTSKSVLAYSPNAIKIGFTATSTYGEDKSVDQLLGTAWHRLSLRESIESGVTAPIHSIIYKTDETISTLDPQLKDFSTRELEQLAVLKGRNNAALDFARDFVESGRQGVIACVPGSNLAHARFIAESLCQRTVTDAEGKLRNIRAASIGTHNEAELNSHYLKEYEAGRLDVLTFVKSLELGWDSQAASFLINASPTASPVRMGQLIGRVLRRKEDDSTAIVVDFVDKSAKQQITSLHILGEETIDNERIIGTHDIKPTGNARETYLRHMLNPLLYAQISAINGMTLRDLYFNELGMDRLLEKYNKQLAEEGMPEEFIELFPIAADVTTAILRARAALETEREQAGYTLPAEPIELAEYIVQHKLLGPSTPKRTSTVFETRVQPVLINESVASIEDIADQLTVEDTAFDQISSVMMADQLGSILQTLSERQADVIKLRFGLYDGEEKTLAEVGKIYDRSVERIRQLEREAMSKLRHPNQSEIVRDYLPGDAILSKDDGTSAKSEKGKNTPEILAGKNLSESKLKQLYQNAEGTVYAAEKIIRGAYAAEAKINWLDIDFDWKARLAELAQATIELELRTPSQRLADKTSFYTLQDEYIARLETIMARNDRKIGTQALNSNGRNALDILVRHGIQQLRHARAHGNTANNFNNDAFTGWNYMVNKLLSRYE